MFASFPIIVGMVFLTVFSSKTQFYVFHIAHFCWDNTFQFVLVQIKFLDAGPSGYCPIQFVERQIVELCTRCLTKLRRNCAKELVEMKTQILQRRQSFHLGRQATRDKVLAHVKMFELVETTELRQDSSCDVKILQSKFSKLGQGRDVQKRLVCEGVAHAKP